MILYKNVDICDLDSIMRNGLLSMDECGNDNWSDGHRADNDTSVVYFFSPIGKKNTFPNYGAALLEVDCDVAVENPMGKYDCHRNDYKEYVVRKLDPGCIKRIIIPEAFKSYVSISPEIHVTWCGMSANVYDEDGDKQIKPISSDLLEQFCRTAPLMDTAYLNYFRGISDSSEMIDLEDVEYIF